MAKRKQYTDSFRAACVLMLETAGYPNEKGALSQVAKKCGISYQLLKNWATAAHNPPPQEVLSKQKKELKDLLEDEVRSIFTAMLTARDEADYKTLGTVAGILLDKLQLLSNKPTERVAIEDDRLTDAERASRLTALLNAGRARRDGRAAESRATDD